MLKHWWKFLGVAILIYVFIFGLTVPLKTGISAVSPQSARTSETLQLQVKGYNTSYTQSADQIRAWLKMDATTALASSAIQVTSDRDLQLQFNIPAYLPSSKRVQDFTLLIDHPTDGAHVYPSAVFITQDSIDPSMAQQVWANAEIGGLHEKAGITFPFRNILGETIRNTYFHVAIWFAMVFMFIGGLNHSIRFLRGSQLERDIKAAAYTRVGILLGILGITTGGIWANFTWGIFWSGDVKQNMTAIALLIYLAYFVLRNAFDDPEKKARISAVYNIFAFAALIPLIYVIPRMTDSLHPGAGGNPAMGGEDLDNTMRMVFYPAIIGWTLLAAWITQLTYRLELLRQRDDLDW
ncbi:MAG: cytochrome c biogenesis protein CcsA [Phaeodactylibacter sp.]|nr:cytochrome c biogenesis protein CcsA [Phaeodactylibacter sp.]